MPALARGDAERLLRFVGEAESLGGDEPFTGDLLVELGELVRADWIFYRSTTAYRATCSRSTERITRATTTGSFEDFFVVELYGSPSASAACRETSGR